MIRMPLLRKHLPVRAMFSTTPSDAVSFVAFQFPATDIYTVQSTKLALEYFINILTIPTTFSLGLS